LNWILLGHALLATALMASSASALNQFCERDSDARMDRTRYRPLPSGRLNPTTVLVAALIAAATGLVYFSIVVSGFTALLWILALVTYLLIYTPLKRRTPLHVIIGTIPFALPPVIGWAVAAGSPAAGAWALALILVFWQGPPHFGIAWVFRDDFARAGIATLSVHDPTGARSAACAVGCVLALMASSTLPYLLGTSGPLYLGGVMVIGALLLVVALRFAARPNVERAHQVFYASLVYLALLLALMVIDKVA
jgi:protoheme IX farnesyltransferase